MSKSKLEYYSELYISDVYAVCQMMLRGLDLGSKNDLIKHREAQSKGEFYLDGVNIYNFHGRGCRFSNNDIKIDWDFGCDENWCGLDPWKLAYYIRDNKRDCEWEDGNRVKKGFDDLVIKGRMKKRYDLYYLT